MHNKLSKVLQYASIISILFVVGLFLLLFLARYLFYSEVEQRRAAKLADALNSMLISEEIIPLSSYKAMGDVCRDFGFLQLRQDGSLRECSFVVGHAPLEECRHRWIWGGCLGLRVSEEIYNEKWLLAKIIKSLAGVCLLSCPPITDP